VNRRGPPSLPRTEWYQWPEKLEPQLVEKSREKWNSDSHQQELATDKNQELATH
jgi:hypothetical protein